jgi:hypothetical protein
LVEHYWHSQWNSQYVAVKFDAKETADMKWRVTTRGENITTFLRKCGGCEQYASIIECISSIFQFFLDWNNHNGKGIGIHFCDPNQGFFRTTGCTPLLWNN